MKIEYWYPVILGLIMCTLFIVPVGLDIYEEYKFIKEHGMTKYELKCKNFCEPLPYYFDRGGLFANDICECKYGEVNQ